MTHTTLMPINSLRRILAVLAILGLASLLVACDDSEPEQIEASEAEHSADNGEWCKGHGLPESHCTKCHPELIDKFKEAGDWCEEHGFPESACPECNPMTPPAETQAGEVQAAATDEHAADNGEWCKGHGLPESHCTKCHPELIDKFKEAGDWCEEHGFPESACPKCNPMTPPGGVAAIPGVEPGTRIVLKRDDHEDTVGIEITAAKDVPVGLGARAPARVEFDRNKLADVRAAVPGIVRRVLVDLGQTVEKGDPLFELESAQVGELQSKIRAAQEQVRGAKSEYDRQQKLHAQGIAAARKVELARQELESAQSQLASAQSSLRLAGANGAASTGRYTLRAPVAGTVVDRPAVVGMFAAEDDSLATVVDTRTMWAMIDVAEEESFSLGLDQPVTLQVDGASGHEFAGKVTWISPQVDKRTRTVKVRAEIENPDGKLRANQFARAEIGIAPDQRGVVVPKSAVQRLEGGAVVFIRLKSGEFEPRVVEPGRTDGQVVQIKGDVKVGEPVVTTGAFILKTELARDSIGAGCCEVPEE